MDIKFAISGMGSLLQINVSLQCKQQSHHDKHYTRKMIYY